MSTLNSVVARDGNIARLFDSNDGFYVDTFKVLLNMAKSSPQMNHSNLILEKHRLLTNQLWDNNSLSLRSKQVF